jgi:hypothetical protein
MKKSKAYWDSRTVRMEDRMSRLLSRITLWLPCLLILMSTVSTAQDTTGQIEKKLAGSKGHDWIYEKIVMFLGPGDKCKQGERYRFKADHTVVISKCVDSKLQSSTQNWSIQSVDALETHIDVAGTSYILIFWDNSNGHFMLLRTKSDVKVGATIDKQFQLAEE